MELEFFKYEGTGNDFILIDEFQGEKVKDKPGFAKKFCQRSFGIGSDGVLYVLRSSDGTPLMHMYNPDGSGPDMCGNGIRCVALYCASKGYVTGNSFLIDTNVGKKRIELFPDSQVQVCMGSVSFNPSDLPVLSRSEFIEQKLSVPGREFVGTAASIGNPHLLIIPEDLAEIDRNLEHIGPLLENHKLFPERVNVHFANIISKGSIKLLTWERGAGRTKACGTGATTSVAILHRLGKISLPCEVQVPGGKLLISKIGNEWFMKGKARLVFRGVVNV